MKHELPKISQTEKSLSRALRASSLIYDRSTMSLLAYKDSLGYFEILTLHEIVDNEALFMMHRPRPSIELSDHLRVIDSNRFRLLLEEIYGVSIKSIIVFEDLRKLNRYANDLIESSEIKKDLELFLEGVLDARGVR